MHYQLALVGFDVKYVTDMERGGEGTEEVWKLEILSGPLRGNIYQHRRWWYI